MQFVEIWLIVNKLKDTSSSSIRTLWPYFHKIYIGILFPTLLDPKDRNTVTNIFPHFNYVERNKSDHVSRPRIGDKDSTNQCPSHSMLKFTEKIKQIIHFKTCKTKYKSNNI